MTRQRLIDADALKNKKHFTKEQALKIALNTNVPFGSHDTQHVFNTAQIEEMLNLAADQAITNAPTIEADSGEAVAYLVDGRLEQGLLFDKESATNMAEANCGEVKPLFTSPQKQWVELTDEQIRIVGANMYGFAISSDYVEFARNIESEIKEVNHG
jgi:hypothetical protein